MFAPLVLALLATTPESRADAELELRATVPVVVTVDGRPSRWTSKLRHRVDALRPGTRSIRIESLFGTILYEGELHFEDERTLHASWRKGSLEVLGTTPLGQALIPGEEGVEIRGEERAVALGADVVDDAGQLPVTDAPYGLDGIDPAPADERPERPLALPAGAVSPGPAAEAPPEAPLRASAQPAPVTQAPAASAPPTAWAPPAAPQGPSARSAEIRLSDGMSLEVLYGDRRLILVHEDGALVLDDGAGFRLELR